MFDVCNAVGPAGSIVDVGALMVISLADFWLFSLADPPLAACTSASASVLDSIPFELAGRLASRDPGQQPATLKSAWDSTRRFEHTHTHTETRGASINARSLLPLD